MESTGKVAAMVVARIQEITQWLGWTRMKMQRRGKLYAQLGGPTQYCQTCRHVENPLAFLEQGFVWVLLGPPSKGQQDFIDPNEWHPLRWQGRDAFVI